MLRITFHDSPDTLRMPIDVVKVKVVESITTIGDKIFFYCPSLTSIEISNSVTTIGDKMFFRCPSLTSIVIPNSVTTIGKEVFYCCTSLTSIVIPNSVTTIGDKMFCSCTSLTSIVIPNSVTTIGNEVFQYCTSLTSIEISNSVTTIGDKMFCNCTSLTSIVIPNSVTTIGALVFHNCTSLTSIVIPNLRAISISAFDGCSELTTINAPSFSTTSFSNSPDELKHLLAKAGLYHVHLRTILSGGCVNLDSNSDTYYDMKAWGREKDVYSGRLPLCTAAERCLTWVEMRVIFSFNIPAIHEVDLMTGLPVFMLAAVGPTSDIESVYNLLREYPPAIVGLINENHPTPTVVGKSRVF